MIIKDGSNVKGLNTAATIWCVSAIGLLTSIGMEWEAVIGTLLVVLSNVFLRRISLHLMDKVKANLKEKCIIKISCYSDIEMVVRSSISKYIEKNQLRLVSLEKEMTKNETKLKAIIITSRPEKIENLIKNISAEPEVTSISWEHSKYYDSDVEDGSIQE